MSSKKDSISATIKLALIILIHLLIFIGVYSRPNNLEAYINDKRIGYVNNKSEAIQVYNELITEIDTDYANMNVEKENIKFKKNEDNTIKLTNKDDIKKGILESINGNVNAYKLNISGKSFGYINSQENVKHVLKLVTDKYIKGLNIEKENVISADVACKIDLQKTITNISTLKTQEELSNEIYETAINEENLLNIDIKVKQTVEEEIIAETIIVNDENMYLGDIKKEIGARGRKIVDKEVVYSNGEISKSTILKEEIIISPKNIIIYKGIKNPYNDGVAFLNRPIRGGVTTSNYGARWESFHKGIDIAGNVGDDVMAAIDGEVTYSSFNDGGYGNLIMLKHENDMVTYYAHLSSIHVNVGDKVKKGDIIGAVGNTGFSTGPHLHFELRVNGNPVNPATYIIETFKS